VAEVQQIEAAIGDYQFLHRLALVVAPVRQSIPGYDFPAKIHYGIVGERISTWQRLSWFSQLFTPHLTFEPKSNMLHAP
jgi:hypothetical protein